MRADLRGSPVPKLISEGLSEQSLASTLHMSTQMQQATVRYRLSANQRSSHTYKPNVEGLPEQGQAIVLHTPT